MQTPMGTDTCYPRLRLMSLKSPFGGMCGVAGVLLLASLWTFAGNGKDQKVEARPCEKDELKADPVELQKGHTPPVVIHHGDVKSPDSSVRALVVLSLIVSEQGIPENLCVARGFSPKFDQSAVTAVSKWRFKPAKQNGQPVAERVTVEVSFIPNG
jgi:TonB family protein